VLDGERVPASEKLVSLFEPHTQIIKRQKPGTPVEFGRKLWLEEVEGGIVRGYRVLDHPGPDSPELPPSLSDHQRRFGIPSWLVAGDRGVFSPANERLANEAGVTHVVIPYAGTASAVRKQQEKTRCSARGSGFGRESKGGLVSWAAATGWIAAPNTARRAWVAGSVRDRNRQPGQDRQDGSCSRAGGMSYSVKDASDQARPDRVVRNGI